MRFAVLVVALVLGACGQGTVFKSVLDHYDECAARGGGFPAIADCGKKNRTAYCEELKLCSANGDSVVAYADSLAASVHTREISDPEAMRRWIEFRNTTIARRNSENLQRAAIINSNMPRTCNTFGNTTTCY